jgi:phosphinothricin acetyltransferase
LAAKGVNNSSRPGVLIRAAQPDDAEAIATIYNYYIERTIVTFEEEILTTAQIQQRLATTAAQSYPWLVLTLDHQVQGYAYAAAFHPRSAYRSTVTSSIYLAPQASGRGWGTQLYQALLDALPTEQCHTAIALIALPNAASVALHEKLGFKKVGHLTEVGRKFGRWIDVGYWQWCQV